MFDIDYKYLNRFLISMLLVHWIGVFHKLQNKTIKNFSKFYLKKSVNFIFSIKINSFVIQ